MGSSRLVWAVCIVVASASVHSAAAAQETTRVSVDSFGVQANAECLYPSISSDGRWIAFSSIANNLVPGDTNGKSDVFVHDRGSRLTSRVSLDSMGVQGNGGSLLASISADGRFVAFHSDAFNLVSGDTNDQADVFVHDRLTGQTSRVSVNSFGAEGNLGSGGASISADGLFVAFSSGASNLVPGDTNGVWDVFVHDRSSGKTHRVSVDSYGVPGNKHSLVPAISASGRYIAFQSESTNLVPGFDSNTASDVYLHDRVTGMTRRASVNSHGILGNLASTHPSISGDGRYVAFDSYANNLVPGDTNRVEDVFVHDFLTSQTTRVSVDSSGRGANGSSFFPSISGDGRYVAFFSWARNLVLGDTNSTYDVFVHDQLTRETRRVSVDSVGVQGNGESVDPTISADGRHVAFYSGASNLVPGDTNGYIDVFVHVREGILLAVHGSCPGPVALAIESATPLSLVVVLYGPAGNSVNPRTPCKGILLGLAHASQGALLLSDSVGRSSGVFHAPAGACGLTLQAVDLATCEPSNSSVL